MRTTIPVLGPTSSTDAVISLPLAYAARAYRETHRYGPSTPDIPENPRLGRSPPPRKHNPALHNFCANPHLPGYKARRDSFP